LGLVPEKKMDVSDCLYFILNGKSVSQSDRQTDRKITLLCFRTSNICYRVHKNSDK
jgi:hypothetical protein